MANPTGESESLPEVLVAVSTSRLSCKRAGKTRTLMLVWDSSGESRLKDIRGQQAWARRIEKPTQRAPCVCVCVCVVCVCVSGRKRCFCWHGTRSQRRSS